MTNNTKGEGVISYCLSSVENTPNMDGK